MSNEIIDSKKEYMIDGKTISLEVADKIVNNSILAAKENRFQPICATVIDSFGHTIVSKRMDGTSPFTCPKIAHSKALTCLAIKNSSRVYGQSLGVSLSIPSPSIILNQILSSSNALCPYPGGVLVRDNGSGLIVGAVGVSGASANEDEYCAWVGIHQTQKGNLKEDNNYLSTEPKEQPEL